MKQMEMKFKKKNNTPTHAHSAYTKRQLETNKSTAQKSNYNISIVFNSIRYFQNVQMYVIFIDFIVVCILTSLRFVAFKSPIDTFYMANGGKKANKHGDTTFNVKQSKLKQNVI